MGNRATILDGIGQARDIRVTFEMERR